MSNESSTPHCLLCSGTGVVIVRGSTDGHEWKYHCAHDGTIRPFQKSAEGQITVTYGDTPSEKREWIPVASKDGRFKRAVWVPFDTTYISTTRSNGDTYDCFVAPIPEYPK